MSKLQLTKKELIKLLKKSNTYITQSNIKTSTPFTQMDSTMLSFGFATETKSTTTIRIDLVITEDDEE